MAGSGLARRRQREPARPDAGRGAVVDDALHQVDHEIANARVEDLAPGLGALEQISARGIVDGQDESRPDVLAVIGKNGVSARDLERRRHVSPERQRGGRQQVLVHAGLDRQLPDPVVADHLGQAHRGHVERLVQSLAHRDRAVVFLLVIPGVVSPALIRERRRFVHQDGSRRDHRLGAVYTGVQGGSVDEGLEGRAGWPPRQHVVELADAVIAPADKGFQLPGVRVHGDQRDLRLVGLRRWRALRPLLLGELAIDLRHPCADRVRGGALQVKIDGRVNP